jgi:UDP-glucose 4-epimerase
MELMVDATFTLFSECAHAGVGKTVLGSCASVYGAAEVLPTSERHASIGGQSFYGVAKVFAEGLLRAQHQTHGTPFAALRYFDVYGPRMTASGGFNGHLIRWMSRLSKGEAPVIVGTGHETIDAIHVEDAARANLLAALAPEPALVVNVGSGRETSLATVARLLCRLMERPHLQPALWEDKSVSEPPRRRADVRLAREVLGFDPKIPLKTGLERLLRWSRAGDLQRAC